MPELIIFIALLPAIFLLHDFEEIIMFKPWLTKKQNGTEATFCKILKIFDKEKLF